MFYDNLERKNADLSSKYIFNQALASAMMLALNCTEEMKRNPYAIPYEIDSEILEIRHAIHDYAARLPEILNGPSEERSQAFERCLEIKKNILSVYESVYLYKALWGIYAAPIHDASFTKDIAKKIHRDESIDFLTFYTNCMEFISAGEDDYDTCLRVSRLLQCAPLKMSKGLYFQRIENSLSAALGGSSEQYIKSTLQTLKNSCAPDICKNYQKYFSEIAQELSAYQDKKWDGLSENEFDEAIEDFDNIGDGIELIEAYVETLFDDMNSLLLLFFTQFSFDDLMEENLPYADLYYSMREFLNGQEPEGEKSIILERLHDQLENSIDHILEKSNEIGKQKINSMEKMDGREDISDDFLKIVETERFVMNLFLENIIDVLFRIEEDNEDLPAASESFLKEQLQDFSAYMSEYFSGLPLKMRKSSMLALIGALPSTMTPEEAIDYLRFSVESAVSMESQVLILNKTASTFSEFGFNPKAQEEEEHDHHHHHDGCGCGHDHDDDDFSDF